MMKYFLRCLVILHFRLLHLYQHYQQHLLHLDFLFHPVLHQYLHCLQFPYYLLHLLHLDFLSFQVFFLCQMHQ
jgi:hypothetical protein